MFIGIEQTRLIACAQIIRKGALRLSGQIKVQCQLRGDEVGLCAMPLLQNPPHPPVPQVQLRLAETLVHMLAEEAVPEAIAVDLVPGHRRGSSLCHQPVYSIQFIAQPAHDLTQMPIQRRRQGLRREVFPFDAGDGQ